MCVFRYETARSATFYSTDNFIHVLLIFYVTFFRYRIIPALPGKEGLTGKKTPEFLEDRRRGLNRYLLFVSRHPSLKDDELTEIMLTETGDVKARFNAKFKAGIKPEFETSPVAENPFQFVPEDFFARSVFSSACSPPPVSLKHHSIQDIQQPVGDRCSVYMSAFYERSVDVVVFTELDLFMPNSSLTVGLKECGRNWTQ